MRPVITSLVATELTIPFRVSFKHASADRHQTASVWVEARTATSMGHGESCPRPYVTDETVATALQFCREHQADLCASVTDLASLRAWAAAHADDIDRQPAAWCAIELALLDALSRAADQTVEAYLGLDPLAGTFSYSAVIGDMDPASFAAMAARYAKVGFRSFKIKLSGDLARDAAKIDALRALSIPDLRLRADANNLWRDASQAIDFVKALEQPFWAIEEPAAARDYDALARVGDACGCSIILDESAVRASQLRALPQRRALQGAGSSWIVNVRVSKMGGLLRSLDVVRHARDLGIGVIVGAQVGETSVLTRVALTVAQHAGRNLLAQEGAFGTELLERDVVDPPLMFGAGGLLDVSQSVTGPGFGLRIGR